jgi:molybdopterin converting factor small subunit
MVKIKLVGSLVSYAQKNEIMMNIGQPITVSDLIAKTECEPDGRNLSEIILEPELNDPRPNVIILINDREIGLLDGLQSTVSEDDTVVFIPVTHGG